MGSKCCGMSTATTTALDIPKARKGIATERTVLNNNRSRSCNLAVKGKDESTGKNTQKNKNNSIQTELDEIEAQVIEADNTDTNTIKPIIFEEIETTIDLPASNEHCYMSLP